MRRQPLSLAGPALGLVFAAAVLAGCGSSSSGNGVAAKTPAEIIAATKVAADAASSVHVTGSSVSGSAPVTLDLDLLAGRGGRGRLSQSGLSFELIRTGGTAYIKGSPDFYRHFVGAAAAQRLRGKWLKAPATSGVLVSLVPVTDLRQLVDTSLARHGTLAKGATATVNGQQAIAVSDTSKGGTLYIATTGQPYPIEETKTGAGGGRITFDRWNEPVSLAAPANAIDLSRLQSGH